jgi:hypothetical protein
LKFISRWVLPGREIFLLCDVPRETQTILRREFAGYRGRCVTGDNFVMAQVSGY